VNVLANVNGEPAALPEGTSVILSSSPFVEEVSHVPPNTTVWYRSEKARRSA